MIEAFFFLVYWAANFAWLLLLVGSVMAHFMNPSKNKNTIILCTVGVLSLLFILWMDKPQFDDSIMSNCQQITNGC
jgi:hypothetical protein